MTEVRFYHLQRKKLEQALPEILTAAYSRGHRILVKTDNEDSMVFLNQVLWTYKDDSFLPHGSTSDINPEKQSILLTLEDDNKNDADVLILTKGTSSTELDKFDLCCEIFDGLDHDAVQKSRKSWVEYKNAGHSLIYYQQEENGRWTKKATA